MEDEFSEFRAVKQVIDLGSDRKKIIITDANTGRVILEGHTGSINFAFNDGVNSAPFNGIVSREVLPDGREYRVVTNLGHDSEIVLSGFYSIGQPSPEKPKKHTGGKRSFVKIYIDKLTKCKSLNDREIGAAIKLSSKVSWNTGLIAVRKKPVDFDGIKKILNCSNQTASKRIDSLKNAGILLHDKDGYKLSLDFISKGK